MQGEIRGAAQLTGVLTVPEIIYADSDPYTGAYEITPTDQIQVIPIDGKVAEQNIIINPIPSNYGLVTWDGVTLRIT